MSNAPTKRNFDFFDNSIFTEISATRCRDATPQCVSFAVLPSITLPQVRARLFRNTVSASEELDRAGNLEIPERPTANTVLVHLPIVAGKTPSPYICSHTGDKRSPQVAVCFHCALACGRPQRAIEIESDGRFRTRAASCDANNSSYVELGSDAAP